MQDDPLKNDGPPPLPSGSRNEQRSGVSIAALIFGFLSITFILAPIAIILGIIGIIDCNKGKKGMGMAVAGMIMGFMGFLILPIMAAIALPALLHASNAASGASAMATLRSISTSQAQFRAMSVVDQDQNGSGEYAFLKELAGASAPRGRSKPLDMAYVSNLLQPNSEGIATKNGYNFYIYLPDNDFKKAMGEKEAAESKDPSILAGQENRWICYAWPIKGDSLGVKVFVIDESAQIFYTRDTNEKYIGNNKPAFDAAYDEEGKLRDGIGRDGLLWRPAY